MSSPPQIDPMILVDAVLEDMFPDAAEALLFRPILTEALYPSLASSEAGPDNEEKKHTKEKKKRKTVERSDPRTSVWWEMLMKPDLREPTSKTAKLFRRRFRLPLPAFDYLMTQARKWFPNADRPDAAGRPSVPLELKVLGVLRILGRGVCFDDIEELTK